MKFRSVPKIAAAAAAILTLSSIDAGAQVKAGPEFKVNTFTTDYQTRPEMAVEPDGDFIVTWQSYQQDGSYYGVFGQRYSRDGCAEGRGVPGQHLHHRLPGGAPRSPSTRRGSSSWSGRATTRMGTLGMFGQRYDANGARLGAEFQVNTYTARLSSTASFPIAVRCPAAASSWSGPARGRPDGNYGSVRAQRFDPAGARLGAEFQMNTFTTGYQCRPVGGVPDGRFVVVWDSTGQRQQLRRLRPALRRHRRARSGGEFR